MSTPLFRLRQAFFTGASPQDWGFTLLLFLLFAAVTLLIIRSSSLFRFQYIKLAPRHVLLLMIVALFTPSLPEELVYRVLLVPHPQEIVSDGTRFAWAALSLGFYVAAHPLLAWLIWPWARRYFYKPGFLAIVFFLGLACTIAYIQSASLWSPVAIHWATIVGWKLFFGGPDFNLSDQR